MKFIISSVSYLENFGGPSLINGLDEILNVIFPKSNAVCLDHLLKTEMNVDDNKIIKKIIPKIIKNKYSFLINALTYRIFKFTFFKREQIFENMIEADMYINAEGIKYCDALSGVRSKSIKDFIPSIDVLEFSSKVLGKKVVSYTKSYGPIMNNATRTNLKFYGKFIYDFLYCREKESQKVLIDNRIKKSKSVFSYDSGVMMDSTEFPIDKIVSGKYIIISVSFQIRKQWKNDKITYFELMIFLIDYIIDKYEYEIILLPNEFKISSTDDLDIALEIKNKFKNIDRVKFFDIRTETPKKVKYLISKSEFLIGSRYHAVVASLSSGVPVIVIGWHYKYQEIMKAYDMESFVINNKECSKEWVINKIKLLINDNNRLKEIILKNNQKVKTVILNSGKMLKKIIQQ